MERAAAALLLNALFDSPRWDIKLDFLLPKLSVKIVLP
jgi:hypothetical protein